MNPNPISVQEAFDRHADNYDERFSKPALGESVRLEVWKVADRVFGSARNLLDLGSGTGEDSIHYAQRGTHVTAVDVSSRMIDRVKAKATAAGVSANIHCVVDEMNRYVPAAADFDGIISNFGAVNCLSDLTWVRNLAQRGLRPGSHVVLTTMGTFYPLEMAAFLLKGQFVRAFRRFHKPCQVSIESVPVTVHYHSLKALRAMLGSQFQLEHVAGLRALLPVPGWEHLGHSAIFRWLAPVDRLWCRWRLTATFADHFISVWRYQP